MLGTSYLVKAQFFGEAYVVQTINIFPEHIEAVGWNNAKTITFQNLDEYALPQEFNTANSASLIKGNAIKDALENQSASEVEQTDVEEEITSEDSEQELEFDIVDEFESEEDTVDDTVVTTTDSTSDTIVEPDSPDAIEEINSQPEETSATTTVLKKANTFFALAVAAVLDTFSEEETETPVTNENEVSESAESENVIEETSEEFEALAEIDDVVVDESESTELEEAENLEGVEAVEEADPVEVSEDETFEEPPAQENEGSTEDATCTEDCLSYVISLSKFGYPIDETAEISGAQLRLSFSAIKKRSSERVPEFLVNYSLDSGASWQSAGSIVIDDEVSNSINGGYYLFALPDLADQSALNNLQVELVYQDNPALVEDLYVESAWLELFTIQPPEISERTDLLKLLSDDGYDETPLSGDTLTLPNGEEINFTFTDDNTDETLIIKSSENSYQGLTKTKTYFSVTNESQNEDEFSLQAYFPEGIGEVTSLREFTKNAPRKEVIPEYRPFVYNCEAGWEFTGENTFESLEELSKNFSEEPAAETQSSTTTEFLETSQTEESNEEEINFDIEDILLEDEAIELIEPSSTTVSLRLFDKKPLLQLSSTVETILQEDEEATEESDEVIEEEVVNSYSCRNTSVIRTCDSIDGGGTACVVNDVKIAEHDVVRYKPGWVERSHELGELPKPNILKRVGNFLGLGPDTKEVPEEFEPRAHTAETYKILPGETRYFEMEIRFPQFSSGEYWIEAIGNDEYGLLDPFWSSTWQYKMPITIDNTAGTSDLTEQQVFLELGSSLTDFWTNVASDGSDIRFVQEFSEGSNEDSWYSLSWTDRIPVTIQASAVDAVVTDFPVYVDLSTLGTEFFAGVKSDGSDIRITTGDGRTEVPYELVTINTGTEVGELHFKADTISDTADTTFYIYYGNTAATAYAATDTYGSENVWTNGYESRYAMDDSPAASGAQDDSTSNGNDAVAASGMTIGDLVTGQIGTAVDFDGSGDVMTFNTPHAFTGAFTLSGWWNFSGNGFAIAGPSGSNEKWGPWNSGGGNVFVRAVSSSDTSVPNPSTGTWHHMVLTRDTSNVVRMYVDGGSPNVLFGGAAQVGTSDWENFGGQSGQQYTGVLDEMRISNVQRSDGWVSTEFNNQNNPSTFYATSSPEVFTITTFTELDYWIQHFDNTADEADIWVQVADMPSSASTTIYLYYGNSSATSESDEFAPFTHTTLRDTYYALDTLNGGTIEVYSLIDNNIVQLDSGATTSLNAGETVSLSGYTGSSILKTLGPVSVTIDAAGADTLAPIAFATTSVLAVTNRNTQSYDVISPFSGTTVSVYEGASGSPSSSTGLSAGVAQNIATDVTSGSEVAILEASEPILVRHDASARDSFVAYPPTTRDLFGIRTQSSYVSTLTANPDPVVYCSDGSSATVTGILRGEEQNVTTCTNGANGTGDAVRFTGAATPIAATQQADSDGNESTSFLPQHEFATEYYLPTDAAYVAIVCSPRFGSATIEVQSNDGLTTLDSDTCSPTSVTDPGKAYMDAGLGGSTLAFSAGSRVVATNGVPFYVIYEDVSGSDQDETNLWGAVQSRQFTQNELLYSFGAQEVSIDAQYTQNSFWWFENTNAQTPINGWDIGESGSTTEGVSIAEDGAVNASDVLRLRMNLSVSNATGTAGTTAMKLQYSEAETCSLPTNSWFDVGEVGSTTAAFSGYDNAAVSDGATLSSGLLASTSKLATYEEENFSEFLPNELSIGDFVEYDWVLTNSDAVSNTNYCFRMVRVTGSELAAYDTYPELLTSGPPDTPTLLVYFDNEHTPDTTPVLEFVSTDVTTDDIAYQVQVDDTIDFSSTVIDKNSITNFLQFENVNNPSDKSPFNNGDRIRFTAASSLSAGTYYWRVRATDPDGSNSFSDWSTPFSFTINTGVTVSEWFQTTGDQFNTDTLLSLSTSSGAVSVSGSSGELTTTAIDFDDATVGNAWGSVSWNDTETSGTITYQVQYNSSGVWNLIPNSVIPNNSIGIGTSPINLLGLDTDIYNEIRIVATFTGTSLSIQDLTVSWGEKIPAPELGDPFDHEKIADQTPTLTFTTTDPQGDDLIYQVSYGTDATFVSSTTLEIATTTSGSLASYTIPATLTNTETYWWRVRARDPLGDNTFSNWSDADAFTIDTGVVVSTWFQTTDEQFRENTNFGLEASGDSITITDEVGEYGTVDVAPSTWVEVTTLRSYSDMVVVASPEYAGSSDDHRSPRVRNKGTNTFEIKVDDDDASFSGTTTLDYIVMEAGTWTLDDGSSGIQVIAGTKEDVSDVKVAGYSGAGEPVLFSPAFSSAPSALATVSSDNDSSWVSTHIDDASNSGSEVTTSVMGLSLGRQRTTGVHDPEDIDYMVFGTADGTNNSVSFEAFKSSNSINCCNTGAGQNYQSAFSSAPAVTVVHSNGTNGGDGTTIYKELETTSTNSTLYMNAGEIGPGSGTHTNEVVSIVAFESSSGILLRNTSGALTGTMYSEPITFSDGSGPKFEDLSWNDSEPGGSTLTYQVQYYTGSAWALISDGSISGNSSGTTTSPIDLTGVNVGTYDTIRLVANFTCNGASCPSVNDWQVTWSEGVTLSGTAFEYDRSTPVNSGDTVRVAVNGSLQANTGTITSGAWSINNVTAFAGDTITVFVDGAAEADEAVNVFVYDGVGDMQNVVLYEQHLTFNSDEKATTTNAALSLYDNSVSGDEDIFFDVDGANDLTICSQGTCSEASLYIGTGHVYIPDSTGSGNVRTHDFINNGKIELDANTFRVSGSWKNNATVVLDTSTVIFTATSTTESIDGPASTATFYKATFGETSGSATWTIVDNTLDINSNLNVAYGTLSRNGKAITVAGNLTIGANGYWSGEGNTTFDGTGLANWSDANAVKQSIGTTTLAGTGKTVTLTSSVRARAITINSSNTLNGGGANTLYLSGNFTNNNTFVPQTSTIVIDGAGTNATIKTGASSLYNLTASTTAGGMISFSDSTVGLLGNLTIATGTVNMPTTLLTVAGSFANNGGYFAHNNSEVRFTGSGSKTVLTNGSVFYNNFYNLTFAGSGAYSFLDTNATTTNNLSISAGTVTLPSGQFTVAGDFLTSGSGAVAHNNGTVVLLTQDNDSITTNGSALNNVIVRSGGVSGSWYDSNFVYRIPIVISASEIDENLTNFPVLVDLADLPSAFFANVRADGGDIRITESDGVTEVPREITSINTGTEVGELHFKATALSSTTNSTFYLYYGNPSATDYADSATYGAENVWTNGFVMVEHMDDLTTSSLLNSADNTLNGTKEAANNPIESVTGKIYESQDFLDDHVAHGDLIGGTGNFSFSGWFNADNLTGSGETATYGYSIFGVSPSGAPYTWLTAGGTGFTSELRLCAWEGTATACSGTSGAGLATGNWYFVSISAIQGGLTTVRVNGTEVLSYTNDNDGSMGTNFTLGDLREGRNINFDGRLDEIRLGNVTRTASWQDATYRNQATTTDFYSVGSIDGGYTRSFADTNATIVGNVTIEASAEAVLPSGILNVGGSFDNAGDFTSSGGTINFDSSSGSETIDFGVSTPNNLAFNNAGGDWTIVGSATTTGNVALTSAANFVLQTTEALYVGGQFTNDADGSNTTWAGTTLTIAGGADYAINSKASSGDSYNVLTILNDGDVSVWNSAANTYNILDTSSLYSQDHDGVDGDLYIFGDYFRGTGTEYWSYATDFDGTDLTGGSERQVFVSVESGGSVTLATSSLSMLGTTGFETTVDSQSGTFALTLSLATLNAQDFIVTNTDTNGMQLLASTTIGTFADGNFDIVTGSSAMTIDATTVDTNPTRQVSGVDFNTAGGDTNITLTGVPTSYLWFRDGVGDRYGETYDSDDGNPGSIRFDDSTYGITISGVVYDDDGVTPSGAPICDGVSNSVQVAIDGSVVAGGSCSSVDGSYSISGISYSGDPDVVVFIDNDQQPVQPAAVTLRSESTSAGSTNGAGAFSVTKPASVADGDTLVMIVGKDDNAAITGPAGWTAGDVRASTGGSARYTAIYYKRVSDAASEPASYSLTADANEAFSAWIGSLVDVDPVTPEDVSFSGRWAEVINSNSPSSASVTTVTNGSYVLSAIYVDNQTGMTAPGAPWSTRTVNLTGSDNNNLIVSSRTMASPGAAGAAAASGASGGDDSNTAQFAFRRVTYSPTNAKGAVVTRTPTADITDMDIYQNRVIVRHEDSAVLSIANMVSYDADDDSDIPFTATLGSPDTLTVSGGSGLYVWDGATFTPDGNVTLTPNGNANYADGTLSIGDGATFTAQSTESHSIGGSFTLGTSATYTPASATVTMTATTTGKVIAALGGATISVSDMILNGGGQWGVTANLSILNDMQVISGTVNGTGNITLQNGSLYGNGVVAMTGGTTLLQKTNTFGGTSDWTFNNLTLGDGTTGTTSPVSVSTTTIMGVLNIAAGHYLDAGANTYDLEGTGAVFVENGTFLEDTSTVIYGGAGANITSTAYYNLSLNSFSGSATYIAPSIGLLVSNDLLVGQSAGTSVFDINTNDPAVVVNGDVFIASNGTIAASNAQTLTVAGDWTNNGIFTANGGTVDFDVSATSNINAGNSSFANLNILGNGSVAITNNATTTVDMNISSSTTFTQNGSTILAVGGEFTNDTDGTNTTWTGSVLTLYGGTQYEINSKTGQDSYDTVVVSGETHPRLWNSTYGSVITAASSSIYSMDHASAVGDLYIFGDYINSSYNDHWSYATDFDGVALGSPRQADVYIEAGGSATYIAGSLSAIGSSTASTTIQNQGSGTYALDISGTADVFLQYLVPRDMDSDGITFTGTPSVSGIANNDFLVELNSASAMRVAGGVIDVNPALNFNKNSFADDVGVTGAINVRVDGTSVSSWRFANEYGDIAGESFDADSGDPGEIVWSDSAALITISGHVYLDEGVTASGICDGVTPNIRMVVAGLTTASTTCDGAGLYTFTNVGFSSSDEIVVYISGEAEKGATVTVDPISNILNMDVYENRVIVRHEGASPISIADMAVWDSSDDADIPFTAVDAGTDTLTLPANRKLIIWTSKTFTPNGNVTVSGGGAGAAYDGTLEALTGAKFVGAGTETHTVGGSFVFGSGATFTSASSSLILTTTGAARTIDINNGSFNDITFNGSGSWTMTDTTITVFDDMTITNGSVTLPTATTTVYGSFDNSGGSFVHSGTLALASTGAGNVVAFNNSDANNVSFTGTGSWTMTDTNATSTGDFRVNAGSVTLPSGVLTVENNFINQGVITHNSGTLHMAAATGAKSITLNADDLYSLYVTGAANFTMTDSSATLLGDLLVSNGTLFTSSTTLAIGGSLDATAGTLDTASSTVLFNSSDTGEAIYPGVNEFYNIVIGSATGGWLFEAATTTNNFTLNAASNFTLTSGRVLSVGGVFTNNVADGNTTWTNTTLALRSSQDYTVNTKTVGDTYENVLLLGGSDLKFWNSSYASTTLVAGASIYSQDNGNVAGALGIYGDFDLGTTTENWSYATDFDGTTLTGGSRRAVTVTLFGTSSSVFTMDSGGLNIIGAAGATTTIQSDGTYRYPFTVTGGTLNATYYSFNDMNVSGLTLTSSPTITNLANGEFVLAGNTSNLISLATSTLNANPSKIFSGVTFRANSFTGGVNVELSGTTTNAWNFPNGSGDLYGEAYDADGLDDCGSIRFDDSNCLLVEQTHYRWRHDGGGLGVPDAEWYDLSWTKRMRVRVVNDDNTAYATTSAKVVIPYDADMQTDFDDLRFTATDGLTLVPYWTESVTVATEAVVWVAVPSLPAQGSTDLYMYYGSTTASTISDGAGVFTAFDDFEDGNISEYSGDTGLFTVGGTFAYGGSNGLDTSSFVGSRATDGIYRNDVTTSQGDTIHYRQYVDTSAGSNDEVCTLFGVQSPGSNNQNYGVCLEQFGTDRMTLVQDAESTDSFGGVSILASTTVSFTTGWYEVFIDWNTNNTISVYLYNSSDTLVGSVSVSDSTYTSGGIGFTYWGQNGGWDSYFAYPRTTSVPSVVLGFEQIAGGGDWVDDIDVPATGFEVGDVARLRLAIENTGLDITDQEFELEFAPKGTAPSCGSISGASFTPVPSVASCGTSDICLASSTQYTSGDATFDLLTDTSGLFVAGQAMEDPDGITAPFDVDSGYYTEVEYALQTTINTSDEAYCFRVTDNGVALDSYATVAELTLQFDPVISNLTFNEGFDISLLPGTTTAVYATGTVTDLNGYADILSATSTFYRSGVAGGAACTPDNNNCYISAAPQCSFTNCSGTSCEVQCYADMYFHADPTDADSPYEGEEWFAFIEVEDTNGGYDSGTAIGQELTTLRAIDVEGVINYGSLAVNTDTGSYNASTSVLNEGNVEINIEVQGTDLSDGSSSVIPANGQKFATSTFTYSACGATCALLSSTSPVTLDVELTKPTTDTPPVEDEVFWGIALPPSGVSSSPHQGINVFTPISP